MRDQLEVERSVQDVAGLWSSWVLRDSVAEMSWAKITHDSAMVSPTSSLNRQALVHAERTMPWILEQHWQ